MIDDDDDCESDLERAARDVGRCASELTAAIAADATARVSAQRCASALLAARVAYRKAVDHLNEIGGEA